jgi:hypothetical protein
MMAARIIVAKPQQPDPFFVVQSFDTTLKRNTRPSSALF